jgi:hypothetical protein
LGAEAAEIGVSYMESLMRILAGGAGLLCLALGFLLYENEEGKIQSTLENFWVSLDDQQRLALSRHRAFLRKVALLTNIALDRVFGERLIGVQSIGVSLCLFAAALFWVSEWTWALFSGSLGKQIYTPLFLLAAFLPSIARRLRHITFGIGLASYFPLMSQLTGESFDLADYFRPDLMGYFLLHFYLPALASAVLFLALARQIVRLFGGAKYMSAITYSISLFVLLLIALCADFALMGLLYAPAVFLGNLALLFVPLAFCLLVLSLLVHKLAWPLPVRAMYALQRYQIVRRKALMRTAGLSLVSISTLSSVSFEAIKNFFLTSLKGS